jgi:hypothetical protein
MCFLLGIGVFALYETIAHFQALNCSYQEQTKRETEPGTPSAPAQEQRKDGGKHKGHPAVSEPLVCSVFGFPTNARIFANENEGAVVGGFTMLLVFVTGWLVLATTRLWQGAEDTAQRQLRAYVAVYGTHFKAASERFESHLEIKNTGQTPARNCRIITVSCIMLHPPTEGFDFTSVNPITEPSVTVLAAGQRTGSLAYFDKTEFTNEEIAEAMKENGWLRIYSYGNVTYDDVFGNSHWTNFCLYFQREDKSLAATNSQYHNAAS